MPSFRSVEALEADLIPLRRQLADHPIYTSIKTETDLRIFLQAHVFAVWDFMSLLKSLQRAFTCVSVPWIPTQLPAVRRFINEIVLGEESDEYCGLPISHFEVYLQAMSEAEADMQPIHALLSAIAKGANWKDALDLAPAPARQFVQSTFHIIEQGSIAAQAAAFTFGREDVIPDMFRQVVGHLNSQNQGQLTKLIWYLERHIEVDGDHHGPIARNMLADICGDSDLLWQEAAAAAKGAIKARLALWDGVRTQIVMAGCQIQE